MAVDQRQPLLGAERDRREPRLRERIGAMHALTGEAGLPSPIITALNMGERREIAGCADRTLDRDDAASRRARGMPSIAAITSQRTPDAPRPRLSSFNAIISRVVAASRGSPTPQQWERMRLRCSVAVSPGAIFTEASLPNPVFTP